MLLNGVDTRVFQLCRMLFVEELLSTIALVIEGFDCDGLFSILSLPLKNSLIRVCFCFSLTTYYVVTVRSSDYRLQEEGKKWLEMSKGI